MTYTTHYLFIRIWFNDGFCYEKEIKTEYDIQWSLSYSDDLIRKHGLITDIIIDTQF